MKRWIWVFALFNTLLVLGAQERIIRVGDDYIQLNEDRTWEYVKNQSTDVLMRDKLLRSSFSDDRDSYELFLDTEMWHEVSGLNELAQVQVANTDQSVYGMLIYEGVTVSQKDMEGVLIGNARTVDPQASVLSKNACKLNGISGELVEYTATNQGIDFTFFAFVTSGKYGTFQLIFFSTSNHFDGVREDVLEAISGLEIYS